MSQTRIMEVMQPPTQPEIGFLQAVKALPIASLPMLLSQPVLTERIAPGCFGAAPCTCSLCSSLQQQHAAWSPQTQLEVHLQAEQTPWLLLAAFLTYPGAPAAVAAADWEMLLRCVWSPSVYGMQKRTNRHTSRL